MVWVKWLGTHWSPGVTRSSPTSEVPAPTIVIIEDDDLISELIEFVLQREGSACVRLHDGRAAEAWLREASEPAAAVLVDLILPYKSGWELLKQMQSLTVWRDTPVLVLTSSDDEKDIVRAFEMGASDYVSKPFRPVELVTRLKRHLKLPA